MLSRNEIDLLSDVTPEDYKCFQIDALSVTGNIIHHIALLEYTPGVKKIEDEWDPTPPCFKFETLQQELTVEQYKDMLYRVREQLGSELFIHLLQKKDQSFGQNPLSTAIGFDNINAAEAIIDIVCELDASDEIKREILNDLTFVPDTSEFVEGSTRVSPNLYSSTPLLLAIQRGNISIINKLINSNLVDINKPDANGFTPLDWSILMKLGSTISYFISKDACVSKKVNDKYVEFMSANDNVNPVFFPLINQAYDIFYGDAGRDDFYRPLRRQVCAHFWDKHEIFKSLMVKRVKEEFNIAFDSIEGRNRKEKICKFQAEYCPYHVVPNASADMTVAAEVRPRFR